jgi:Zn finger protein HypA/HybF involved in hydrogenase expression
MMAIIRGLLPEGHHLPGSLYESTRLLRALKMPYEQIHYCLKGCVLFREEHKDAKYCPKCKSSRYVEVDKGDGKEQNEDITMKVLRHLLIIPRL